MKTLTATPTVMNRLSKDAQSKINDAKRQAIIDIKKAQANDVEKDEKSEKPEKSEKKMTKKEIVIMLISKDGGSTINEMAEKIVEMNIDNDLEKNKRTCRLWLSKLGMPVKRLENGNYIKG